MKAICCLVIMLSWCVHQDYCVTSNSTYTTQYDGVDIDFILKNDKILSHYIDCLLDRGPCTPDGKELKINLPDAINNDCAKCSEKQRIGSEKVMHHIIDNIPNDWEALEKKFDPEGSYKKKYLQLKVMEDESKDNNSK